MITMRSRVVDTTPEGFSAGYVPRHTFSDVDHLGPVRCTGAEAMLAEHVQPRQPQVPSAALSAPRERMLAIRRELAARLS